MLPISHLSSSKLYKDVFYNWFDVNATISSIIETEDGKVIIHYADIY